MTTINLTIRFETFVILLKPIIWHSLVPWLCRGMQWLRLRLSSNRMFAPFLCACRFWASCVSGGGATQSGLRGGAS